MKMNALGLGSSAPGPSKPLKLQPLKPILKLLPEVQPPEHRQTLHDRVQFSVLVLLVMLVLSHLPLYGVPYVRTSDSLYWARVLQPLTRNSVLELGVAPLMTAGFLLQILAGSRTIEVITKDDRACFAGAQKLLAMVLALVQALAHVWAGVFGTLGVAKAALVVIQMTVAAWVVILLDQAMEKGYGFGPGVSLYIACNACTNIVGKAVSFVKFDTSRGSEYEGAFVAFVGSLFSRSDKFRALQEGFGRPHLPNVTSYAATVAAVIAFMFFQRWRIELQVKFQKYRGQQANYPVKLLYCGSMPVMLLATAVQNFCLFSRLLHSRMPGNLLVRVVGSWEQVPEHPQAWRPVSGLAYYVSPPQTTLRIFTDPFHSVIYIALVLAACVFFAKLWIGVSGSSPGHVARQLRDQQIVMKGHRDVSMREVLSRYIPPAAMCGGAIVGAVVVAGDFLGAIGSGTGVVLGAAVVYQYHESLSREQGESQANSVVF